MCLNSQWFRLWKRTHSHQVHNPIPSSPIKFLITAMTMICSLAPSQDFFLNIVFYSSDLFHSHIYYHHLPGNEQVNAYHEAFVVAKFQAIIATCSTILGYWFNVYLLNVWEESKSKWWIFSSWNCFFFWMNVALVHLTLGIPNYMYWDNKPNTSFLVLYALTFFFSNVETHPLL